MATAFLVAEACAVCARDWPSREVPTIYTLESIDAQVPPQPIYDHCVEDEDPALFEALLADRRRFWGAGGAPSLRSREQTRGAEESRLR